MKLHQRGWGDGSVGKNISCTIVEIWDQILNSCVISHARPPLCLSPTVVAGESLRLAHQPSNSRFLTHCVISQSSGWDTPSALPDTRWGESEKIHATGYHGGFYIGFQNVMVLWLTSDLSASLPTCDWRGFPGPECHGPTMWLVRQPDELFHHPDFAPTVTAGNGLL